MEAQDRLSSSQPNSPLSQDQSPLSSPRSLFPLSLQQPSATSTNPETALLQQRVRDLEREINRRRISLNFEPSYTADLETLVRSNSEIQQGKDAEVMRLQVALAVEKLARERREAEIAKELNCVKEENSRLKVQLEASEAKEIRLSQELLQASETVKIHISTIETLTNVQESLLKKVEVLEAEVYSEKQHSSDVQRSTSEALKQLLASKIACENDLEAMKEQHLRCITNSSKVEQNLRAQVAEVMAECHNLREKQPVPVEVSEMGRLLEVKNSELTALRASIATLEEKWLKTSAQLVQERSQYFESSNLLYQENESLRHENESLKQEKANETRSEAELQHKIQLYELRFQSESELQSQVTELQETITRRDQELHRREVELETQKVVVRGLEDKLRTAQERLEDKIQGQKSEEALFICELTKEKLETERLYFAEVERRAKIEDQLHSREKAFQMLEKEYKEVCEVAKLHSRSNPKRRSCQSSPNLLEPDNRCKPQRLVGPLLELEEAKEPAPVPTEVAEVPHKGLKEAYASCPCNCLLS